MKGCEGLIIQQKQRFLAFKPYNNNFIRILERHIRAEERIDVEVINLGIMCIGPKVASKVLEVEGIKYDPDLVIFAMFVGNDFLDDEDFFERKRTTNNTGPDMFTQHLFRLKFVRFISNYFRVINRQISVLNPTTNTQPAFGVYTGENIYDETLPTFSEAEYMRSVAERVHVLEDNATFTSRLQRVVSDIRHMKDMSDTIGAQFLVLLFPDEFQINHSLLASVVTRSGNTLDEWVVDLPQRSLIGEFQKYFIPYLDVLAQWKTDDSAESYFLLRDMHLNSRGNVVTEKLLYPVVKAMFTGNYE